MIDPSEQQSISEQLSYLVKETKALQKELACLWKLYNSIEEQLGKRYTDS
jgi:hypothetical protein